MDVRLTPEQSALVRRCIGGGQYRTPADVIGAALQLLDTGNDRDEQFVRAVKIGLEQVCVERAGYITADDIRRRVMRRQQAA